MSSKPKIIEIVGQELLRYEFDSGIVFLYREPSTQELFNYKNSIKFRRRGKSFTTLAARQQFELADAILEDAEGLGFKDPEGKLKVLDKNTKPAEIAHLKMEGVAPASWKDLVPARLKFQFIEGVLAGLEEEEKN